MATGIEVANAYVALTAQMPGVQGTIRKALGGSDVQSTINRSGQTMGGKLVSGLGKALKFGAAGVGTIAAAGIGAALVKGFQRLDAIDTARAKLTGLGHDAGTVDLIMSNALTSVKGTAFGLGDAATVAAQAVAAGIKPGKDLEGVLGTVANTAAAAGTDLGDMGSIFAKAMSQANGIQNDVLGQLADKGIPIYQALADQMGVTSGEVFKLAQQGEINFDTFARAAEAAGGTVASEMGGTWKGSFDNFMASLGRVGEGLLSGIFPQLKGGLQDVTQWLEPFEAGAKEVGAAIGDFVADAGPKLVDVLKATFEAGQNVVGWIRDNYAWIGPLAIGVGSAVTAWTLWTGAIAVWQNITKIATGIQYAFNAAMRANPIGLIVTAITAVVSALIWFFTQTEVGKEIWANFTQFLGEAWANISGFFISAWENVIKPVFDGIAAVVMWVWENVIQPVSMLVVAYFKMWGSILSWLWTNVVQPTFNAIGAIVTWIWQNIISPIVTSIVNHIRFWAAVNNWLWTNVVKPVFDAIGQIFEWIWTSIIKPIIGYVVAQIQAWGAILSWLWTSAVRPTFKAIGDIFSWVWTSVIKPVIDWIRERLAVLGRAFAWLYENGIKPAWDKAVEVLRAGWAWVRDHVFKPFRDGIDLLKKGFEIGSKGIKKAWGAIKSAAAKPINFVLDTVWNKGLRSFWNDVVGGLGLDDMKLKKAPLVKFASGGVMPGYTPGRDVHNFYSPTAGRLALSGGEAIMRPEFTRAVGGKAGVDRINALARSGQAFAGGGVWGWAGDAWKNIANFGGDVLDNIKGAASLVGDFITDPVGAVKKHVIEGVIKPLVNGVDQNIWLKTAAQMPLTVAKGIGEKVAGFFSGGEGAGAGHAGDPMQWQALWSRVKAIVPGAVMTSNYRPGSITVNGGRSYHGLGRAIDVIPATMDTFNRILAAFPDASELIFSPAGGRQLLNGSPHMWSGAVRAQHWNHVHLAMANGGVVPQLYDQGGWLPHGGLAVNRSGRPEAVLDPQESAALKSGLSNGRTIIVQNVRGASVDEVADQIVWAERRLARGGKYAR